MTAMNEQGRETQARVSHALDYKNHENLARFLTPQAQIY
jgi:hypothetical protein